MLNDEKDLYIKNILQKDKLISKKADDIFNKINKGEFIMKKNEEAKNEKQTKENLLNLKKKSAKWKKILATAACLVIVLGAANVYATSQGYENVFFLIKYLVTGEGKANGKDSILSDRDVTISYEPINIEEGISIKINRLQIKDKVAKLFVITDVKDGEKKNFLPIVFKAYNEENVELCNQKSIRDDKNRGAVTDELILNGLKESDNIINLEMYKANSEKIATLIINLDEKTVEVQGAKEALQKISEIELKQFLGYVGGLSKKTNITDNELKITLANYMLKNKNKYEKLNGWEVYRIEEVDKMLESFIGEKIQNFKDGEHIKTITNNENRYYTYANPSDERFDSECINVSNIAYCNGLYTVNYSYYYRGVEEDADVDTDYYDIYEQVVCISLNHDDSYSKFKVVSMEEPTLIKKAIDKNSNNNQDSTTPNEIATDTETSENKTTETNNTTIQKNETENLEEYKGVWQYFDGIIDIPEMELTINRINSNTINFDYNVYRIAGFVDINGTVSGNVALFEGNNDTNDSKIKGNITFDNNKVIFNITESTHTYVKPTTITFTTKSNKSILK